MDVDYGTLQALRKTHPAWKLLVADHSPLIAAFLHRSFVVPKTTIYQYSLRFQASALHGHVLKSKIKRGVCLQMKMISKIM